MFSSINTCWVLVAAFLVYFMQAGFALCEAGFTRAKNTGNILMKNMMDFCIGTPCYWVIGFGLMFGGTSALIGGFDPFIQGDYSHLGCGYWWRYGPPRWRIFTPVSGRRHAGGRTSTPGRRSAPHS